MTRKVERLVLAPAVADRRVALSEPTATETGSKLIVQRDRDGAIGSMHEAMNLASTASRLRSAFRDTRVAAWGVGRSRPCDRHPRHLALTVETLTAPADADALLHVIGESIRTGN